MSHPALLTVGVLGGLGPEATLDFFSKVLEHTTAARDQDHLHLLIDNNPQVPNRNEAVAGTGPSPGPMLAEMAAGLEAAGADFLVMPCNAAHAYEVEVRAAAPWTPFISIIAETVEATLERVPNLEVAGVLAASGCLDAGLYRQAFGSRGVQTVEPEGARREHFMALLYRIKSGDKGDEVCAGMQALSAELVLEGAQAVVAGCTEVPLVLGHEDLEVPLVNSTDALVNATIAYASGDRPLPERP